MARKGAHRSLLDGKHASGCDGTEYSALRPVVVPAGAGRDEPTYMGLDSRGAEIEVVWLVWCGECGAADWDLV